MKTNIKKVMSVILVAVIGIICLCVAASAADGEASVIADITNKFYLWVCSVIDMHFTFIRSFLGGLFA